TKAQPATDNSIKLCSLEGSSSNLLFSEFSKERLAMNGPDPRSRLPRLDSRGSAFPRDFARRVIENPLADADRLRRYFDELVLVDPLEALLERHDTRRRELHRDVGGRRAHVGEVLFAADLHDHVDIARVLAD